ncbi:tudor domain-containing protein 1-like [Plakobranchus ocellatus]|uniref:Tudor domain-containing protein 1-like n=1 Tax=Plakobranchus ocellatus TaxID=259542 RepID=A0AAV3Z232_9GAST|nr:tudor domain-containing protein 1-like [Plakobranchus ocellatus]
MFGFSLAQGFRPVAMVTGGVPDGTACLFSSQVLRHQYHILDVQIDETRSVANDQTKRNYNVFSEAGKVGPSGRRVCVFYNRRGGCYRRENCPNLHVTVPPDALGEVKAVKVKDQWIRAKVIESDVDQGLIQVCSVDFGWTAWVAETALRDLELRFLHLPPQAVLCSLARVEPMSGNSSGWTPEACQYFADLVLGKSLVAYVKERFPSGLLGVVLHDTTSGPHDLDINQMLVDAGWAKTVSPSHSLCSSDEDSSVSQLEGEAEGVESLSLAPA